MLICLDGADAVGKTTQTNLLAAKLQAIGYRTWKTKEPGGPNPLSQSIRQILLNPETTISPSSSLLLFLADRFQNGLEVQEKLDQGYVVISDRSAFSSFVYHAAAQVEQDPLAIAKQIAPLLDFAQNVQPDLCVVCSASYEWSAQQLKARKTLDRIEQLGPDFHKRVHEFFKPFYLNRLQTMMERAPQRVHFCKPANQATAEQICDEIFQATKLPLRPQDSK